MPQSSRSDSEDDETMKRLLEATDHTLLSNAMFQLNPQQPVNNVVAIKSQRQVVEEADFGADADLHVPESLRDHFYNKLSALLSEQVDYCDTASQKQQQPPCKQKKMKSRLLLFSDADSYLKSNIELDNYLPPGPSTKPKIERRKVETHESNVQKHTDEERLASVVVTSEFILAGADLDSWADKRFRSDKFFRYKSGTKGVLVAIEPENEFSALRRKNKWSEAKIKQKRK